nr:Down syndrome cell adhesion molecule-like protein Dscam2 [Lepeophtheirus salmonis]
MMQFKGGGKRHLAGSVFVLFVFLLHLCSSYGPSFLKEPQSLALYSNATGALINCIARGEPPPNMDWVNEAGVSVSFPSNVARLYHNGSLSFYPFSKGAYHEERRIRCRASNAYGRIVSRIVTIKPGVRPRTGASNASLRTCIGLNPLSIGFVPVYSIGTM